MLHRFVEYVVALDEARDDTQLNVYSFHTKYNYWPKTGVRPKRPLASVFLPEAARDCVVHDLDSFLSAESKAWYGRHGIPFKRNCMFHGPPGSGKTSIIQALASHYDRNVCFIQPCHPEMTDEA